MRNLANSITVCRIIFAVAMLFTTFLTVPFWICYLCAGISDIFDGFVARKFNQCSEFGAKLDSIADIVFAASIAITVLINVSFPLWLWVSIIVIALLRFTGYAIDFYKFHTFSSLHTILNKATGFMIFAFPILILFLNINVCGIIITIVSLCSSIEELIITIKSKELNRNCQSIFKKLQTK